MRWEVWTLFAATETALCLTPGPAVLLVLSQALARGTMPSLWSNVGILGGNNLYFILSATGLGAIILSAHHLFFAIRWIGAAYLCWLGLRAFIGTAPALRVSAAAGAPSDARRMLVDGFILQATNPKALVFFTALLPQFIDPRGNVAAQVAILAATSVTIEFFVLASYALLAGRMTHLAAQPRFVKITNRAAGMMLMAAGIGMAAVRGD